MGGLRAVTRFLSDNEDRFHKCVLISAGGTLNALSPPDVDKARWRAFVEDVRSVRFEELRQRGVPKKDEQIFEAIQDAFFIKDFGRLSSSLTARGRRIQAIVGSRDVNLRDEARERLQERSNIEIVADMEHVLGSDVAFELHYPEIVDRIVRFLRLPESLPKSRNQVRDDILYRIQGEMGKLDVEWLVGEARKSPALRELYLLSKGRFTSDAALIDSLIREWRRRTRESLQTAILARLELLDRDFANLSVGKLAREARRDAALKAMLSEWQGSGNTRATIVESFSQQRFGEATP